MKRKWLISSICLVSIALACSGEDDGGDDDATGGTGGTTGGTGGTATGGSSGSSGAGGKAGSGGTGGISFGGNSTGGTGGTTGGTGGTTGGTGGTGGATGGSGGTGGTNSGNPCTAAGWTAGSNVYCGQVGNCPDPNGPFTPSRAIDGNPSTRYTSGKKQDGTEEFTITFSADVSITGITLTATNAADAPVTYVAEYSTNGTAYMAFTTPVTGAGTGSTAITFPATVMKAIKIKQTGTKDATSWWSINELTVQGCVEQ